MENTSIQVIRIAKMCKGFELYDSAFKSDNSASIVDEIKKILSDPMSRIDVKGNSIVMSVSDVYQDIIIDILNIWYICMNASNYSIVGKMYKDIKSTNMSNSLYCVVHGFEYDGDNVLNYVECLNMAIRPDIEIHQNGDQYSVIKGIARNNNMLEIQFNGVTYKVINDDRLDTNLHNVGNFAVAQYEKLCNKNSISGGTV